MVGFIEILLLVLMLATILFWAVLITFLWWELIQLKKIRQEMEELPTKLSDALKFMEGADGFSNELKDEIVPMIMGASSDLRIASDDTRTSIDTILKSLKEPPPWINQLVSIIDLKFAARISKIEEVVKELKG